MHDAGAPALLVNLAVVPTHDLILAAADGRAPAWRLLGALPDGSAVDVPFHPPGDVHSALLAAGLIPDPYVGTNELAVDWVCRVPWRLELGFDVDEAWLEDLPADGPSATALELERIDGVASVRLNDAELGLVDSSYRRFAFGVDAALVAGPNLLALEFAPAPTVAAERAAGHPLELPWLDWNSRIEHSTFLRRPACHAGWDWNIALMPVALLGDVLLRRADACRFEDVRIVQRWTGDALALEIEVRATARVVGEADFAVELHAPDGSAVADAATRVPLVPGERRAALTLDVDSPERWWPRGQGDQALHRLVVTLGAQRREYPLGLREVRLDTEGGAFTLVVNGRATFCRGANLVPADALPARETRAARRALLDAAIAANMNTVRVWGGGRYEPDDFHEDCDALGLLVWQDFMFACNHYPAGDRAWLASVRAEAVQQTRRLSRFASTVLLCGDNELRGTLDWWEITRRHRDRYLANYVRLNAALEDVVAVEAPSTPWWPSSPSTGAGPDGWGNAWKDDASGDMHFWDVWHEAAPFDAYRKVHPRFCSEFGFQSLPSMPLVERFAAPEERHVSSATMEVHQRNVGGNARIVETLVRHFRFPDSFARTVYLSQVQQAMAIETAVAAWRSTKPRCGGILYWQLNDTWPVASWSSVEHGGAWKLLHHAARRFYSDVCAFVLPLGADGEACGPGDAPARYAVRTVNDTPLPVSLMLRVRTVRADTGEILAAETLRVEVPVDRALEAIAVDASEVPETAVLLVDWAWDAVGRTSHVAGDTVFAPLSWKRYALGEPNVRVRIEREEGVRAPRPGLAASRAASLAADRSAARTTGLAMGRPTGRYGAAAVPVPEVPLVGDVVVLETDRPAFHVALELGGRRIWSDNGVTVLPGEPRRLRVVRSIEGDGVPDAPPLSLQHL